jgi:hypothetical protein
MERSRTASQAIGAIALILAASAAAAPPERSLTSVAAVPRLGAAPVTVRLAPNAGAAASLAGPGAVVSVSLEDIGGATDQPVRINVFIDRPGATRSDPITHPNWVGTVNLMPLRGTVSRTQRLELRDAARWLSGRRPVAITLVPVVGRDSAPRASALHVRRIYLRSENF